ncbi:hypothetical protein ES703_56183 [subsurface metagenome]
MNIFLPTMLVKSIGLAAMNATISPGVLQPWVDDINRRVAEQGKFSKSQVGYLPFSPPPVFWNYKCKKCLAWQPPSSCKWVEGKISPNGWCAIWIPMEEYKAMTWPKELLKGDW